MQYRVIGNVMPAVEMLLEQGESVYTQSGGMAWMNDKMEMQTNTHGGLLKGLGRMLAGESVFMSTYTATASGGEIGFSATVPGEVMPVDVGTYRGLICQKGAFLCAQTTVSQDIVFKKKLGAGLFGGEGFILQQLGGSGMAFLEIDGNKIEKNLAPGEVLRVDTGNVVAFEG
ncbi:MAG: AIM24 family protein, partial [Oscillospiraceae bacterium]|nr:AIM24 family protein [Oscillospiraceae bacterium]